MNREEQKVLYFAELYGIDGAMLAKHATGRPTSSKPEPQQFKRQRLPMHMKIPYEMSWTPAELRIAAEQGFVLNAVAAGLGGSGRLAQTVTQPIPVPRPAASKFQVGDKVKIMTSTWNLLATGEIIQEGPIPNPPNYQQHLVRTDSGASHWRFENTLLLMTPVQVVPAVGMTAVFKANGRIGTVRSVDNAYQSVDVNWDDGQGGTIASGWWLFDFVKPAVKSGAAAGTKQGIIDAVMAVDNVVWCDVVEDNAAGKIHILVREDEVNHASRSHICDAILQTKPAGVRAVGPIRMNGAAFQLVTKAELFSGVKLYGEIAGTGRTSTVVTSRVRVCAKCGNQSKHAESETSMGLCFDCFEARR